MKFAHAGFAVVVLGVLGGLLGWAVAAWVAAASNASVLFLVVAAGGAALLGATSLLMAIHVPGDPDGRASEGIRGWFGPILARSRKQKVEIGVSTIGFLLCIATVIMAIGELKGA